MNRLLATIRRALRVLLRDPVFVPFSALIIGLGIATMTIVFSVAYSVFVRPLSGVRSPGEIVEVGAVATNGSHFNTFSYPVYQALRRVPGVFHGLAAQGNAAMGVRLDGIAKQVWGVVVTPNYFQVLGVSAGVGRGFTLEDDNSNVVVLSYKFWTREFGADSAIVGQRIELNGQILTVVGVAPRGFTGTVRGFGPEVWVPIGAHASWKASTPTDQTPSQAWLQIVGRLDGSVPVEVAKSKLAQGTRTNESASDLLTIRVFTLRPAGALSGSARAGIFGLFTILMLAAGGLLLAAVANVSGMLLARSSAGSREIAIRLALGAQPANLIRQFATEGLMLGGAGAIAGVAISVVALRWLNEIQPPVDVPLALDLSLSPPVLSLACSVALVVAVVFMVIPTREASRTDVMNVLRNGSQTASRADTRLRIRFVTLQVIFTVVLLTVAGAFAGAVRKGINTDAGIATDNVVVAGMNLETSAPSAEAGHALQERLLSRIRAVAYVDAAALTTLVPLGHTTSRTGVSRGEGGSSASIAVSMSWVSSEYFQVLKIPLVRGREFQDADRNGLPLVAIINETLAGQLWGREDPVGQPLRFGGESYEVIGIARNGKYNSISEAPQPFAYFALAQEYASEVSLVTRLKASPDAALSALPRLIRDVDPGIPVADVRTMDAHVALNVLPQRIIALLTAALGIVGLLLASIGLYGTVSYTSATRTREFGIRMALGETSQSVLTDVVKGSISIVVKGLAIGSCLAAGAMLLLRRFVFGIGPLEVLVVAVAACVVLIAAMVASYVPARRATRVDPVIALRAE